MGATTNDGNEHHQHPVGQMFRPLLNPAGVIGLFDIEITGCGERAGRGVMRWVDAQRGALIVVFFGASWRRL